METRAQSEEQKFGVTGAATPMQAMYWLNFGVLLSRSLYVAAELNIADKIEDGHDDIKSLAEATDADPEYLYRILRALAGQGVFEEHADRKFSLTPMSAILLTKSPENFGAFIKATHHDAIWGPTAGLTDSVKSGTIAFDQVMGEHWTDYMKSDQEFADGFHAAMKSTTMLYNSAIADAYDFSNFDHVVDVGGGNGALLSLILNNYEALNGTLVDLEHAIDQARNGAGGPLPRCNLTVGDFFKELPPGGDAYIVKTVLHDWDDEDCIRILKNCRDAMAEGGRVLVIERLIGAPNVPSRDHLADIMMMIWTGGRERTEAEFENLFDQAGLRHTRTTPSGSDYHIIEARAAT